MSWRAFTTEMRHRVANKASDEVGSWFVSRYSLLESADDIDQLQIFSARKAQNLSPNAVYATCHMHVVPCCVAERRLRLHCRHCFTWAFGGLALGYRDALLLVRNQDTST
jgi:hypothetical protein